MAGASMDSGKHHGHLTRLCRPALDQQHDEVACFAIATLPIFRMHQKHHLQLLWPGISLNAQYSARKR